MSKKKKHTKSNLISKERINKPQELDTHSLTSTSSSIHPNAKPSHRLLFNIIALFLAVIIVRTIFEPVEKSDKSSFNIGYSWLYYNIIKPNLEFIENNKNATLRERYYSKWGEREMKYVFMIQDSTKTSDVIAFPPDYILNQVQFKSMKSLASNAFFQYPRKVYNIDSAASILPNDVTKVISINNWGLNFGVDTPSILSSFMILTKKR